MVDISTQSYHKFWSAYHDRSIYLVICHLEVVEYFVIDIDPRADKDIEKFGVYLDTLKEPTQDTEEIIGRLLSELKTGRALYAMNIMNDRYPGCVSKMLLHAEIGEYKDKELGKRFVRRNITFEKTRILYRIFHVDRMAIINSVLEEMYS